MKITRRDLISWVRTNETIRYRGDLYKARYNGQKYIMAPMAGGSSIEFYHKGRGIFGLETNK